MGNKVKIYALSTCFHCKAVKALLDQYEVEYVAKDVDLLQGPEKAAALEDVKKVNPANSFPTTIIGNRVIVGYKKDEILSALDLAA